ncbi:MAG: glycosyltransferase family 4 protein [Bacteroidales bacterium]|jgi:glycosyltransferase involved in cell wall biosynthesis|nr:glycosyltransferase family 4 protein [Bacteroidales bacterium]
MKIVHICNGAQGNSPFYKFFFAALKKNNIEQMVIIPVLINSTVDYEDIHCEYFQRDTDIISRLRFKRKIKKLTQFTEERVNIGTFDFLHAHTWFSDGAVALNLHIKYGIPYIVVVRNTDVYLFFKYFIHLRKLGYQVLEHAAQIVFISPPYKERLVNQLLPLRLKNKISNKTSVIPNGAFPFWLDKRFIKDKITNPVKLLSVGSITPNKNFITLCKAVELLHFEGIDVELTIVGKGYLDNSSYLRKLENYISNKKHITLIEKKNQEELMDFYRKHHIFVLPSHTESFGLVYIEALTQGLPIVYTQKQGIDGYFGLGTVGIAVNSKSITDIAQAIRTIIENYSTFTDNVKQLDFSNFHWENIAKRYEEIYFLKKNS